MSLTNALMIASQSLGTITSQINLASRNISGAGSDEVTKKVAILTTGPNGASEFRGIRRETNISIFKHWLSTNADLEKSAKISDALDQMDLLLNLSDPAESQAPSLQISRLSDSLLNYSVNPDERSSAELSVQAARDVLTSIRDSSELVRNIRKQADDNISRSVEKINDILKKITNANKEIISSDGSGFEIGDMLDRRDSLLRELSKYIGIKTVTQPNQDLVIYADSGATLLETTPRNISFQKTDNLSAGIAGASVYIDGVQATGGGALSSVKSGSIAGDIHVRDNLALIYQAQLDEMARGLIIAFSEKDQTGAGGAPLPGLFTFPGATTIPNTGLISGLADQIMISPLVDPNQGGDASLLRDGGISGNPAYVYNRDRREGYTERLHELAGSASLSMILDSRAGLDINESLQSFAESSIGWIGGQRQSALRERTYQHAIHSQTTITLSTTTGINIDEQMTQLLTLENAYQASAKLLQTINSVYDSLFAAINR